MEETKFRKPTMKDVAEAAGVSVTTVSHVLNRTRYVSEETVQKVEEAVRSLRFKVNPVARHLRMGESFFIGFVVSNLENYVYLKIARGIEQIIQAAGYQLSLVDSAETKALEMKHIESLYLRDVDGIVIAPTTTECAYLGSVLPPGFPLVVVDRQAVNFAADCVLLNNEKASFDSVSHLIKAGRRRIGFVSFHYGEQEIDPTIMERVRGYKKAVAGAGLKVHEELIKVVPGASSVLAELRHARPYQVMEELRALNIDAVFCGNSHAAIGVHTFLQEHMVRIPEDIAMITFDDDLWLSMVCPKISVVEQPAEQIGRLAAERLLARIQKPLRTFQTTRIDAQLILRDSC
jgi:LacI family transcriptional regulator